MKYCTFLLIFTLLVSCTNEHKEANTTPSKQEQITVYLDLKLTQNANDTIFISESSQTVRYKGLLESSHKIALDDSGRFSGVISLDHSGFYKISNTDSFHVTQSLYLVEGDSLTLDFSDRFSEQHLVNQAGVWTLMNSLYGKYDPRGLTYDDFELEFNPFRKLIDSLTVLEQGTIDSIAALYSYPEELVQLLENERKARYGDNILEYAYYHYAMLTDTFKTIPLDSLDFDLMAHIDKLNQSLAFEIQFSTLIGNFLNQLFQEAHIGESSDSTNSIRLLGKYEAILKLPQSIQERALLSLAGELAMDFYGLQNDFFEQAETVTNLIKNDFSKGPIRRYYQHQLRRYNALKPGAKVPELALPDTNGDTIRLSDFEGKVIYLDFWGTWCGPCLAEIPNHKKLHHQLEDEDVVFLSVAMESESQIETWKKMVREKDLPGYHVVAIGQMGHPMVKSFLINAAPTYCIIDREGKWVQARAPRPGSALDALKEVLEGN